jgi:hypothetical protein
MPPIKQLTEMRRTVCSDAGIMKMEGVKGAKRDLKKASVEVLTRTKPQPEAGAPRVIQVLGDAVRCMKNINFVNVGA